MEQILFYRDVRYVIRHEQSAVREWVIYPADGPPEGARSGRASADGLRGSFKSAVFAAQRAIDEWVEQGCMTAADH